MVYLQKSEKKTVILIILPKVKLTICFQQEIFEISAMKPEKLLFQNLLKCLKLKVTKGELWIFIQIEMKSYQE